MEDHFETKDYWGIIALMVKGYEPVGIVPEIFEENSRCQLTYIFEKEAKEEYEKWMIGSNDEPMGTTRKVRDVIESFKRNLHRFTPK